MNKTEPEWLKRLEPFLYMLGFLLLAVGAMWAWKAYHIDVWSQNAGSRFSQVGAFGDAFAPIVGIISSLALGAAVYSMIIQSRGHAIQVQEFMHATQNLQDQSSAIQVQVAEQREANRLASLATKLACLERLDEIDKRGVNMVRHIIEWTPPDKKIPMMENVSDLGIWWTLVSPDNKKKLIAPFNTMQIAEIIIQRWAVKEIMQSLTPDIDQGVSDPTQAE